MTASSRRALVLVLALSVSAGVAALAQGCGSGGVVSGSPEASTLDTGLVDGTVDASKDAGTCVLADGGGGTLCGSSCVDLKSDPDHCGTCAEVCPSGAVCEGQCKDVVVSLDGLRWELPCTAPVSGDGFSCPSNATFSASTTVAGSAGKSYDVRLHFRGIVEQRAYTNATSGGAVGGQVDGGTNAELFIVSPDAPSSADPYNVYTLAVQPADGGAPSQLFRLNSGTSNIHRVFPIDYLATVRVVSGGKLLLTADAIEGNIISNTDGNGQAIVVPGVPPAPAAFNGQFVQVDVVAVTPVP